ncbi:hypothetical protein P4S72_16250 [Vibrio sp. PP-XX7]
MFQQRPTPQFVGPKLVDPDLSQCTAVIPQTGPPESPEHTPSTKLLLSLVLVGLVKQIWESCNPLNEVVLDAQSVLFTYVNGAS